MLKLYGFPLSNYYNKVKLALLEKGVPFEEVLTPMGGGPEAATASPLRKVPYIETEHGFLCESQAIVDYIEARWPTPALIPADPWAAAKVRELITFCDLHIELCARQLYPQAFFGGTLPEKYIERVKADLTKAIAAFKQVAVFGPYAAGDAFTMADCAVYVAAAGIDWKGYVKLIEQRPSAQKVAADRKADQARALAAARAKAAGQ